MKPRLLAALAALGGLLLTAAATTGPGAQPPAERHAAPEAVRSVQAFPVPRGVFRRLTLLDRRLTRLIDYVVDTPKPSPRTIDALLRRIDGDIAELLEPFPDVFGLKFGVVAADLAAIDRHLQPGNVDRVNDATGELGSAARAARTLEASLTAAKVAGQPVPQEAFDGLDAFFEALDALVEDVREENLKQKGYVRRLKALEGLKLDVLRSFPPVYGLPFRSVAELLDRLMVRLDRAKEAGDEIRLLFFLTDGRSAKEALEDLLQQQAQISPILRELTVLDRELTRTIDGVRGARESEWDPLAMRGMDRIRASVKRLIGLLPDVFGVAAPKVVGDLLAIDGAFAEARRSKKGVGFLRAAKERLEQLRARFEASEHDGTDVPDELFEGIDRLDDEIDRLVEDLREGNLTEEGRTRRIKRLGTLKLDILKSFPLVLRVTFRRVYLHVEAILDRLDHLDDIRENTFLEREDVLRELRRARDQKEELEDKLQENAPEELRVGLGVSHTLLDDDPFKAALCARIETSPGATIEFEASGPPNSFGPGFDSATGTTTLAPNQPSTFAGALVYTPATYTVEVTATLPGLVPVEATQTYQVTTAAQGPFACPDLVPPGPAPGMPVSCSVAFTPFDPTEVVVRGSCEPAGPGRPASRPLGVSITRFDVQLPGGRQVTNWLDPSGFTCAPATRTTPNDTLRCSGTLALGTAFEGNIRMVPGPAAGMGGSFYVLAGGSEQGPFAITGP